MLKDIVAPALKIVYDNISSEGASLFSDQQNSKIIDYNSELELLVDNFILSDDKFTEGKIKRLRDTHSNYFLFEDEGTGFMPYGEASISINYFMQNYKKWVITFNEIIDTTNDADIIALIPKS